MPVFPHPTKSFAMHVHCQNAESFAMHVHCQNAESFAMHVHCQNAESFAMHVHCQNAESFAMQLPKCRILCNACPLPKCRILCNACPPKNPLQCMSFAKMQNHLQCTSPTVLWTLWLQNKELRTGRTAGCHYLPGVQVCSPIHRLSFLTLRKYDCWPEQQTGFFELQGSHQVHSLIFCLLWEWQNTRDKYIIQTGLTWNDSLHFLSPLRMAKHKRQIYYTDRTDLEW